MWENERSNWIFLFNLLKKTYLMYIVHLKLEQIWFVRILNFIFAKIKTYEV